MTWDVLLHWMTHVGEGSWMAFRNAVGRLASADADLDYMCRRLRIILSDLAHVDFFVEGSQRWRVLAPVLGGLPMDGGVAVLAGGRTANLKAALAEAARSRQCRLVEGGAAEGLACVRLEGRPEDLVAAASDAGVPHVTNLAGALCRQIVPVPQQIESAPTEMAPGNWSVRSFDLQALTWVDGLRARSACEFSSRYGERRFYLHIRRGTLLRLSKREAVYAAAMIRDVALAEYDAGTATLRTRAAAPLPEAYTRAACLCAGAPAEVDQGRFVFRSVPFETAALLLVAAGQPHPAPVRGGAGAIQGAERDHG